MASQSNEGKRLLASTLDKIAKESPERAWISSPRDDNDLSKGFIDITFRQLSNAVNHASHWLDSVLGVPNSEFEGFAYEGPPDARLAIIALAAVKTRRKVNTQNIVSASDLLMILYSYFYLSRLHLMP